MNKANYQCKASITNRPSATVKNRANIFVPTPNGSVLVKEKKEDDGPMGIDTKPKDATTMRTKANEDRYPVVRSKGVTRLTLPTI